jgi:outer membrane biosynthesis protein TonB
VEAVSGEKLLQDAAAATIKAWRFEPTHLPEQPIEVTVRFGLRCPGD